MEEFGIVIIILLFWFIFALIKSMSKFGNKVNRPDYKKTIGKVVKCYQGDYYFTVIVEFYIDNKPYRAVDHEFNAYVDMYTPMEVFYDEKDPRENRVGEMFDIEKNKILCAGCKIPLEPGTVICPQCKTTLDTEKFMENPSEYLDPDECLKYYAEDFLEENPELDDAVMTLIAVGVVLVVMYFIFFF